jgi:hypothetical protein
MFTDTASSAAATAAHTDSPAADHTGHTDSDGDGLVGGDQSSGSHSAWHSQVFAMWAWVDESASSATLLKFLEKRSGYGWLVPSMQREYDLVAVGRWWQRRTHSQKHHSTWHLSLHDDLNPNAI